MSKPALYGVAAILIGALMAAPLWDRWHYGTRHDGLMNRNGLGVVTGDLSSLSLAPEPMRAAEPIWSAETTGVAEPGRVAEAAGTLRPIRRPGAPPARPVPTAATPLPTAALASPALITGAPPLPSHDPALTASLPRPARLTAPRPPAPVTIVQVESRDPAPAAPSLPWSPIAILPFAAPAVSGHEPAAPASDEARADQGADGSGQVGSGGQAPLTGESGQDGPAQLSLVPAGTVVAPGQTVKVSVLLKEARGVTSVPFHVQFNPEVLQYVGAQEGNLFTSSSLQPILMASDNPDRPGNLAVGLALVESSGLLNASGTLLVLEFRALGTGESNLTFDRASVRGATSREMPVHLANAAIQVR